MLVCSGKSDNSTLVKMVTKVCAEDTTGLALGALGPVGPHPKFRDFCQELPFSWVVVSPPR